MDFASSIINLSSDNFTQGYPRNVPSRNSSHMVDAVSDQTCKETFESSKGLEILGRGRKELVQAIQRLRHLGLEKIDLPLPKIVVVGDQSTGKSSLIEGIRSDFLAYSSKIIIVTDIKS